MIVTIYRAIRPKPKRLLQAVQGKGRQRHHKRGAETGRNGQARSLEALGEQQPHTGVQQRNKEDSPTTKNLPAQVHEHRHGTDGNQAAKVIQHVGEIKRGAGAGVLV